MEITTDGVRRLAHRCRELTANDIGWLHAIGYPFSLALCIIDAIYATGSHPTAVNNVVGRYMCRHGNIDGAKSLRYSIAAAGGERAWAETVVCNLKPANTHPGAPLKAEVINRATRIMADLDIETIPDLLSAVGSEPRQSTVFAAWTNLPSQHSGVTFFHLLALAGADHFEPDRVVRRFLAEAVAEAGEPSDPLPTSGSDGESVGEGEPVGDGEPAGRGESLGDRESAGHGESAGGGESAGVDVPSAEDTVTPDDARQLVAAAADELGVDAHELGRIVWQIAHRRIPSERKASAAPAPELAAISG